MLWSIDSFQNRVSADQYHLTVLRAQVSTHQGRVFFWSYPLTIYSFSNDRRLTFTFVLNSYQICCVYVSIAPHYYDFDFKLTSDAKIQPVFLKYRREDFFLPWSRVGHAQRPIVMLWLVQIWQVSSCVKFESCLPLTTEASRVLSQLVMFLTLFFHWMYKMKYSCYQESSLIHGWFVYWVFGWEMRRFSKLIIRFPMASFLFFTLLDAYVNYKGSSDPCLTW